MPSRLLGADYKLKWSDFRALDTPRTGAPASAVAETVPTHTATGGIPRRLTVAGKTVFQMPDDMTMRITITNASWRLTSVSTWSGRDQVWLINHEQGHYDIYALMVRDFYYRLLDLVGTPFTDEHVLRAQIVEHRAATVGRIARLQQDYDADTENSKDGAEQWNWTCAIERAKQLHRSPLVKAPDGRYLRIELGAALGGAHLVS